MEEKELVEEQPQEIVGSSNDDAIVAEQEENEAERGVPIGKFKSVEDLYQAYNNLQSEFTRKCQKLAEIEKDKTQQSQSQEEKLDAEFKAFLNENKNAISYADEIKERVMQNSELASTEKPFDKVWAQMLIEKLSSPNSTQEPMVQNFVLNDENLKNLVTQNYVKQLQENKAPFVMSTNSGERVTKPATQKPESFEQAEQLVRELLS